MESLADNSSMKQAQRHNSDVIVGYKSEFELVVSYETNSEKLESH